MSRDLQVYGITHITMALSSATNPTLVSVGANVLKSDITIATTTNSASLGTVFISGGTYPAGASTAHMIQASNLPGNAYTITGPSPFFIGVAGLTTTVQIIQSLSQSFGQTFK